MRNAMRGRMMEDIVLLETKMSKPRKQVFRLQFPVGEYDMVVVDPEEIECEVYEIKHSAESACAASVSGRYRKAWSRGVQVRKDKEEGRDISWTECNAR